MMVFLYKGILSLQNAPSDFVPFRNYVPRCLELVFVTLQKLHFWLQSLDDFPAEKMRGEFLHRNTWFKSPKSQHSGTNLIGGWWNQSDSKQREAAAFLKRSRISGCHTPNLLLKKDFKSASKLANLLRRIAYVLFVPHSRFVAGVAPSNLGMFEKLRKAMMVSKESRFQGKYLLSEQFKGAAAFFVFVQHVLQFYWYVINIVAEMLLVFQQFWIELTSRIWPNILLISTNYLIIS